MDSRANRRAPPPRPLMYVRRPAGNSEAGGELGIGWVSNRWTADEQEIAAAVNMRRHGNPIGWAKERGLFVRVGAPRHRASRSGAGRLSAPCVPEPCHAEVPQPEPALPVTPSGGQW